MDPHRTLHLAADRGPPTSALVALTPRPAALHFGRFELQIDERRLLVDGEVAVLQARALDLLIALARRPGHLFTRHQLLDIVWPGRDVEENNLSVQVNALRKVLGNEAIATVPGRGYRYTLVESSATAAPPSARPALHAVSPARAPAARQTHLPDALPTLIGRQTEQVALGEQLRAHRLVTVTGAGGAGKTSLARAVVHAQRDGHEHGVCFIELAALTEGAAVPASVAAALGIRLADGDDPNAALAGSLATMQLLIALDNAEHLVGAVCALAQALLEQAPGVRMLVTSQVRLGLAREQIFQLGALAVPDALAPTAAALRFGAVEMFVARARALDQRFALTDANVAQVVALCRQLDGSPLAIELAATRLPLLGLPGLIASMAQRLALLTRGHRGAPARQQTLRAALAWSHELLSPAERTVFRRMAIFVGSASLAMAQQVLGDADSDGDGDGDGDAAGPGDRGADGSAEAATLGRWRVLEALGGLVDRSLVSLVLPGQDSRADEELPRYRLLESPRALAAERLLQAGEHAALQRRHLQAVRALLEQVYADVMDGRASFSQVQDALEADVGNAQAALRWALQTDATQALAIGPLLSMMLGRRRHAERLWIWRELEPWLDPDSVPDSATAGLLARASWLHAECLGITRPQAALERAQAALAFARRAGDGRIAFQATSKMANSHWRMGNLAALREAVTAMARLRQPDWSPYVLLTGVAAQAWLCLLTQDTAGALHRFKEQAALSALAGIDNALALLNIGRIQLANGQTEEALAIATAMVGRFRGDRNQLMLAMAWSAQCNALLARGEAATARQVLAEFLPLARQFEMLPQWADAAALLAALEARPRAALQLAGYADATLAAMGQAREAADEERLERALQQAQQAQQTVGVQTAARAGTAHSAAVPEPGSAAAQRLRSSAAHCTPDELVLLAFGTA